MKALIHLFIFAFFVISPAYAGSQTHADAQHEVKDIVSFAKHLEQTLAQKGARAFIIARVGRPAEDLPDGIAFTHTAVAIYSQIDTGGGEYVYGYAIHNLYQRSDDASKSMLMTDYPVDFFWGAQALKAGVIIPSAQLQKSLIQLVASGDYQALHNPAYSVLANPYNTRFQNCTEFTLDMINASLYKTLDSERLKANASAYFEAQRVHQSRLKLMIGSALMEDLSISDHKGKVRTATFGSLARFMDKYGLAKEAFVIESDLSIRPAV